MPAARPTPATRRLVLSDTHFGSPASLASSPQALEALAPHLRWADEIVINGDFLSIAKRSWREATRDALPFCQAAARACGKATVIIGNHDHGLEARPAGIPRFRPGQPIPQAAQALRPLFAGCELTVMRGPVRLGGASLLHGHELGAPLAGLDYGEDWEDLSDRLLTAAQALAGRGDLAEASAAVSRRLSAGLTLYGSRLIPHETMLGHLAHVCEAMRLPAGPVIFGHTHQRACGEAAGKWQAYNPGCWKVDEHVLARDEDQTRAWPGGVIRLEGASASVHGLLDGLSLEDLRALRSGSR